MFIKISYHFVQTTIEEIVVHLYQNREFECSRTLAFNVFIIDITVNIQCIGLILEKFQMLFF